MAGIYGFRGGPTYRPTTRDEMWAQALEQPMSQAATFWDQAKGGILDTLPGTAIRTLSLPPAAQKNRARGESIEAYQARQERVKAITEDEYKASPYYREGVPWDSAMTEDRAAALATMYDAKQVRQHFAQKRPITAFIGNLAGQATDPINYIPIAGPAVKAAAVARMGRVLGVTATAALDAAANTALAGLATREMRRGLGDDVSWQAMVSDVAMAALIGTAFGTVGGVLERRAGLRADALRVEAQRKLDTLANTQQARIALNEAIGGLANDGEVRLSPNGVAPIERVARQVAEVSATYADLADTAEAPLPDVGANFSPTSQISGGDVAGAPRSRELLPPAKFNPIQPDSLESAVARRAAALDRLGTLTREIDEGQKLHNRLVRWADVWNSSTAARDRFHYALLPDRVKAVESELVAAETIIRENLTGVREPSGRLVRSADSTLVVNASPARPEAPPQGRTEAEASLSKAENYKALADQYRVDPETGTFPEEAELRQLAQAGRLSEEDMAVLNDADAAWQDSVAFGEALKATVACLL